VATLKDLLSCLYFLDDQTEHFGSRQLLL